MRAKEYEKEVEKCRASGMTIKGYCEVNGIPVETMRTWARRTRRRYGVRDSRKSYAEYREIVLECKQSGRMAKEWCADRGIKYGTYCNWSKKVNRKEGRAEIDRLCGIERTPYIREPEAKVTPNPVLCEVRR